LQEERKLMVFENMVLRRIFGNKRGEVTGDGGEYITWAKCYVLLAQYCAIDKIEKNELGWACGTYV
jgi:hypothetical protein